MEGKSTKKTKIITKYEKLFHHLHVEFPELTELSSKTLETFDISKRRKSATIKVFRERIEVRKKREKQLTHYREYEENVSHYYLQEAAKKCPVTKMSRFQKRDIQNLIGVPELQLKYSDEIEEMFDEVKNTYSEVIHAVAVQQKIKQSTEIPGYFEIQPFKHIGRSKNYKTFLRKRKELQGIWMLHQPLLKSIIWEFSGLPDILINIDRKNEDKINFEDLEYEMQKNLVDAGRTIQDFYWKIEIMVQTDLPDLHPALLNNFLGCCTCAVSIQLSKMLMNTLNYIVDLTISQKMPLLNIHITFNNKMEIFPTPEEIIELFQCLIKDILGLTKPLTVLKHQKLRKKSHKPMSIYLTKEFIKDTLEKVEKNITVIYKPLIEYLREINEGMKEVYKDLNGALSISDLDFTVGCDKVRYYSSYYNKVSLIPENELFDTGVLIISKYISKIKDGLMQQKNNYFRALSSQSLWEMNDIYESFNIIRTRSEIIPLTTEQTIEIGKYMTWVKSEFIQEATLRMSESLLQLAALLELGVLEDDQLNLNVRVIKELDEIEPVVLENLSMYEQLKFEAEEKLQKQIENVNELTKAVHPILCLLDDMDDILNIRQYLGKINLHLLKIKHIETQIAWINTEEVSLSFPKSSYPEFEELKNYVYPFFHLMKVSLDVQRNVSVWLDGQFDLQSYDETKVKIEGYHKELTEMYKTYKKKLRQAQDENLPMRFKGTVDDPDILNWPAPLKICSKTIKLIEDFQPCLSLMKIVCNQSLRNRHWKEMSSIAQIDLSPNAGSTLRKLLTYDLKPHLDPLEIISQGASHEQELLEILIDMKEKWMDVHLKDKAYKETHLIIFSNLNSVVKFIDENMEKLLILSRSAFARPHKNVIEEFSNDMVKLKDILVFYEKLQEKFYHLLPFFIFIRENKEKLEEVKEFNRVTEFKTKLYLTLKSENIFQMLNRENILTDIQKHYNLFECIYFGVRQYLNSLRSKFPRFYFLSNEELIEILSNTTLDQIIIQKYIAKCFLGLSSLVIQNEKIVGIKSYYGEELRLSDHVTIDKKLINIFIGTEKALHNKMIQEILTATREELHEEKSISTRLGQALFIALEIFCTNLTHRAINSEINSLNDSESLLKKYITWARERKVPNSKRNILKSMIVSLTQHIEFIRKILSEKIKENDFIWLAKMKYYSENDRCIVKVLNITLAYGYEFYGDFSSGISTPYTERCRISLLNAYNLNYSSAIHGEACSGKTVTFKNLAMALGVNYKIISCTDCVTYEILERLLFGCSKGNMWLCLDEINKVELTILSLMSDLLQSLNCLKMVKDTEEIQSFVCVTLNALYPTITDLPMTFKSQFRSIGIVPVEFTRLCELTLTALGFKNAKYLSKCVDSLFKTLSDVLSKKSQQFSIKLLKKILLICERDIDGSIVGEQEIFIKAVCNTIQPMLSEGDIVIFKEILELIFKTSAIYEVHNTELKTKIISHLESEHLHPADSYVTRILQLADTVSMKQNVILLGDIFAGKTKACSALFNLLTGNEGSLEIVNPSIFDTNELYGFMDIKYDLWQDGILTKIFKKFSTDNGNWLVFDGPIESYWVETLYSVLEESRVFTLGSGNFLKIKDSNTILFEVSNLNDASPSLISRCSVIYFEISSEPWLTLAKPWIKKHYNTWPDSIQQLLEDLLFWMLPALLKFIGEHCTQVYTLGNFYLVKRTINYVQILLKEALARKDEDMKNVIIWLQASVFLGIYNGLTATLTNDSISKFDAFFKRLSKNQVPEHALPESIEKIDINVPTEGLFSDYFYIYKGRGTFKFMPDTLKNEKVVFKTYIDDVMVPTTDTIRTLTILDMHITNYFPIILTGPTGTAKSLCMNHYVNHTLDKTKYTSIFLKFIPRLTSRKLQSAIQSNLLKKISLNGVKELKKNLIIIEDLNVVSPNENKVSSVVEFLRQTLDYQFWYDNGNYEKIVMENLGFIATMAPQGGLNKNICRRLLKYFDIFRINDICDDNIMRIFSNILQVEWRKNGFAADIALVTNSLMNATLNIHEFCLKHFKTSPLKFSYSYNIWDFLKVLRGLFMLKKESADVNKKIFYKLWTNECARVYGDRLLDLEERNLLYKELMIIYELQFKECFSESFNGIKFDEIDDKIIFSTITNTGNRYEEMEYQNLKETLEELCRTYQINTGVKFVLFDQVLPRIIKISRLLSIENSHALLLGVLGTGRSTLIDLTSMIHKCKVFNPSISYEYNETKWHEALKKILLHTGGSGNQAIMYLNEEHLIYRFILEDVNFFLKNGDIIDLFEIEEEPMVLNMVRLDAQRGNPNLNISSDDVYAFFVNRCKRKLHIFINFNCGPGDLEMRTYVFQSLVKYCTPIWFNEWSSSALTDIASEWIKNCNLPTEMQTLIPQTFVKFFDDSRLLTNDLFKTIGKQFHITTKSFVEFLELYVNIILKEQTAIKVKKEKYLTGLRKLKYADNQIKKLQEHLCAYQLQLKIMSKKAGDMTRQIARETLDVERVSDLVKKDEKVANKQAEAAAILKADCEIDLAAAIPILEDAIQALNTLKPPDITLVKSMKNPPDAIKLVMAAVCVIKDVKPDRIPDPSTGRKLIDYWGPSKRILGDMNFLQSLKDFDKDHIKPEIMVKIRKDYLPHKDFKPHIVAKASSAAEGLCKWIIAMDMYDNVAKEVAPKKEKLEKAEREYAETLAILEQKKLEVVRLEKQLAQLNAKLQEANKKQSRLQKTADACNRKLERSVVLIEGFDDEQTQWSNEVSNLDLKYKCLSGDVLLTSAFIAYLSPIPVENRKLIVDTWYKYLKENNVPVSDNWDLTNTLVSNDVPFHALPPEKYYFENSVIHKYSHKYTLFIDPHGLAKTWIQKTVDTHNLHVVKYGNNSFIEDIKYCLTTGKLLLIENIGEDISSSFNTILNKEIIQEESKFFIWFEDERITFNKKFYLVMTTTLSSPNYISEISDKIKVIDFTVTKFALQKSLLSLVIKTENPLVSKQISIYKKKVAKNENLLKEYQEKILRVLSDAEADLLEDNKALKILDNTKNLYKSTNQEIYIPDKVVPTFELLEENYTRFSYYSCNIFFCIEEFSKMNKTIKFSYKQFLEIFRKSILEAPLSKEALKRIDNITCCFTHTISRQIQRILNCPEEALNFLFHMSCGILLFQEVISQAEVEFLNKRDKEGQKSILDRMVHVLKDQVKENQLDKIKPLSQLQAFEQLEKSMNENQTAWNKFLKRRDPENHSLPEPWHNNLNDFQKFLILQTLRPDRTRECMKKFISNVLDEKYVKHVEVNMEELYAESFCLSPILFTSTNNSSPLTKLKSFAERKKFNNKFKFTCISKGDNTLAEELIRNGQAEGLWVCILNCHLSKTWGHNLEKICEDMTFENTHENFRLWLVCDISFKLSNDLLEKCIRTTYGDTDSFKENLLGSYKDFVDQVNVQEYQNFSQSIVRFIYKMICFHTVLKWRTRFKGIAWNSPFKFGDYDLRFVLKSLPDIMNIYKSNEAVRYLIGEAFYCGQFLNKVDYKAAQTLFEEFVSLNEVSSFSFPSKNDIHDYIAHIVDRVPSDEIPELFGFNDVSLYRKNIRESEFFSSYISSTKQTWNEKFESEKVKEIMEISHKLVDINIDGTSNNGGENMLQFVLRQEIECYNKLKNHILKYLRRLQVIFTNTSLLSPKMKQIVDDLIMNKIPKKFRKYSFFTDQTYSTFIINLEKRLRYMKQWRENGEPGDFWVSAFFHPEAILMVQKILYAKKIGVCLDMFSDRYEIVDDGFKISNLYLINAKFDKTDGSITLLPRNVYFDEIPTISIRPLLKNEEFGYGCPVYRTDRRNYGMKPGVASTNFIFMIQLKSEVPEHDLIKLGVALVCEKPEEI